ncbi:NAPDH-dependent diflavin reductase [Recurvomyces mirabilis]|nr:NAPDH-dependent diflavin reductase [Recurvomyces mirabilis]
MKGAAHGSTSTLHVEHGAIADVSPVSSSIESSSARNALILYGSETGNAQDIAEEIGRMTERLRFTTTVLDLDSVSLRDLIKYSVVIFAISTTGQGEFPQNARRFWKTLLSSALKPGLLRKLGARTFCERGEGNEQHPEGHSAGLREFVVTLRKSLLETVPLPEDQSPIEDDVFLEPKWKLQLKHCGASADGANEVVPQCAGDLPSASSARQGEDGVPSDDILPIKSAYTATLLHNKRITPMSHFQDVRHLDFQLDDRYEYNPGAVAVIYPKNFPEDIQAFIELMAWQGVADRPLKLIASEDQTAGVLASPSPVRHFDLTSTTVTLRWLLENVLDIMSVPRRSFFASLAHFAGTETEDEEYQKERLLELANPELIDELWDYTTRPKRTILEVMMDFTTIRIPWQYVLTALPLMKGRQFSIASGGLLKVDERGRTKVELLVAIADPPSPIIKWRRRYGVCTRYITSLKAGQSITIGMQPGYLGVTPDEINVPAVMIGPGTGLAPMRSMIHQRLAWAREIDVRHDGRRLTGDILIFGCRDESADFFFRNEWDDISTSEDLTLLTAFSRDKRYPRQYVQDKIREARTDIRRALEVGGRVYVCGSSGNMPKGVREALVDVLMSGDGDESLGREEAEGLLDRMEKAGRYKQETW